MDLDFLSFLAEPAFVIPWYAFGTLAAFGVAYDQVKNNKPLPTALKWGFPILVFFFSIIGLALYLMAGRPPRIGSRQGEEKEKAFKEFSQSSFRKVTASVIHCVAGDGLGIITAMIIARLVGMNFWQEFWFEYLVGFAFGWFIFQYKAMSKMTDSPWMALWMGGRAEFFSMMTVMAGMGIGMGFITPLVVGEQPKPYTYAFWGFGALGLLIGFVTTYPMNWILVKIKWKHGLQSQSAAGLKMTPKKTAVALAAMLLMGGLSFWALGALVEFRIGEPAPIAFETPSSQSAAAASIQAGLVHDLEAARAALEKGDQTDAARAMDAAKRVAEVARDSSGAPFSDAFDAIKNARFALQDGDGARARNLLSRARQTVSGANGLAQGKIPLERSQAVAGYKGATVLNAMGVRIGEVIEANASQVEVTVGAPRDVLGVIDFGGGEKITVTADAVRFGKQKKVGSTMVVLPTFATSAKKIALGPFSARQPTL